MMENFKEICPLWSLMKRRESECPKEPCAFYSAELEQCAVTVILDAVDELRVNLVE